MPGRRGGYGEIFRAPGRFELRASSIRYTNFGEHLF
jgi:hypothetical protein